ncbi:MAG: dihydrodipicolinate synthase family protein, partial [Bacteroidota bacterium]
MLSNLKGTGVALVTPLHEDESIDFRGLEKLIDHVIDGGVDYVVSLGTTGESPVFTWEEKMSIVSHTLEYCHGRIDVVLGLGGNNTREILEKLTIVAHLKVTAMLSVSPYYNRPSQEGIKNHYQQIAAASAHPIVLYNVPFR